MAEDVPEDVSAKRPPSISMPRKAVLAAAAGVVVLVLVALFGGIAFGVNSQNGTAVVAAKVKARHAPTAIKAKPKAAVHPSPTQRPPGRFESTGWQPVALRGVENNGDGVRRRDVPAGSPVAEITAGCDKLLDELIGLF